MDLETKKYFNNDSNKLSLEEMKTVKRITKSLQKPSYLKTYFRKETIDKYKNACGNYFGT